MDEGELRVLGDEADQLEMEMEEEEAGEPVLVLKDVNRGKLWDALTKVDLLISK